MICTENLLQTGKAGADNMIGNVNFRPILYSMASVAGHVRLQTDVAADCHLGAQYELRLVGGERPLGVGRQQRRLADVVGAATADRRWRGQSVAGCRLVDGRMKEEVMR